MADKIWKCSICNGQFTGFGNNAWPVNTGRCCDTCNDIHVLAARMRNLIHGRHRDAPLNENEKGDAELQEDILREGRES
jgi:hypothetical protein